MREDTSKKSVLIGLLLGVAFILCLRSYFKPGEKAAMRAKVPSNVDSDNVVALEKNDDDSSPIIKAIKSLNENPNKEDELDIEKDAHQRVKRSVDGAESVRVLCWIMTTPGNRLKKAEHIEQTWGQRCNKLLVISSENDTNPDTISLPGVKEGKDWIWGKTKEGFKYVWEYHKEDADWFMKVDDDSYVIVENLRLMLSDYDTNKPIYFGCLFKEPNSEEAKHAGAEYVLSKEALRLLIEEAIPDKLKCKEGPNGTANIELGHCLTSVGVIPGDSRDSNKRQRFLAFNPEKYLEAGGLSKEKNFWEYTYYPPQEGKECCSDTAIAFHAISPSDMHVFEYLIYRLHPYGIYGPLDDE